MLVLFQQILAMLLVFASMLLVVLQHGGRELCPFLVHVLYLGCSLLNLIGEAMESM